MVETFNSHDEPARHIHHHTVERMKQRMCTTRVHLDIRSIGHFRSVAGFICCKTRLIPNPSKFMHIKD